MKLLGNDVLTQEEFDLHLANKFDPMSCNVKKAQKDIKVLKIVAYAGLFVSILSVVIQFIKP